MTSKTKNFDLTSATFGAILDKGYEAARAVASDRSGYPPNAGKRQHYVMGDPMEDEVLIFRPRNMRPKDFHAMLAQAFGDRSIAISKCPTRGRMRQHYCIGCPGWMKSKAELTRVLAENGIEAYHLVERLTRWDGCTTRTSPEVQMASWPHWEPTNAAA